MKKTICTRENGSFENGTLYLIQSLRGGRIRLGQGSRYKNLLFGNHRDR